MIQLQNVSKSFRLYRRPLDRLLDWVGVRSVCQEFWALRDVDLHVARGRTLGIIGPNGAGKSTLLKLVTGTLMPTRGRIQVNGRVAALLELGTGFHPEFTGRQNIWINGQLLGLSGEEIQANESEIIGFSELGHFIDQPIRTYSSGMIVRLGFAIAASVDPQILIVDEALAVGDARFSQKCIRRIERFRDEGCTILFVSHDPHAISTLCDEAVLLDEGRMIHRGHPSDVLEHYNALLATRGEGNVEMKIHFVDPERNGSGDGPRRSGTFQALVARLELRDAAGSVSEMFVQGSVMTISMTVLFFTEIESPTVGFLVRDHLGVDVFGTNTRLLGMNFGRVRPGQRVDLEVKLPLKICHGDYTLTVAVHRDDTHLEECFEWCDRLAVFKVRAAQKPVFSGRVQLDPEIAHEMKEAPASDISEALEQVFSLVRDPLPASFGSPSPFLKGFSSIDEREGGACRWIETEGTFVFRPRANRLALAVELPARPVGSGVALSLHSPRVGDLGTCRVREAREVVEFLLPTEAVGRLGLFGLSAWDDGRAGPGGGAGSPARGVAVYAIRTLNDWEEIPSWNAMIPSASSRESSNS